MVDVSAIIVNYNTGAYTQNLVECLRHERAVRPDGSPGEMEILVVENDSPTDQEEWLAPLEQVPDVRVIRSPVNGGYGGGCNLGAREAKGRHLLFLNPDLFIVPGAVAKLSEYLDAHPEAGQVGPRGWYDAHRFFHLPRIELPSLTVHFLEAWRRTSRARAEAFARRRTRHALRIWSATKPQPEPVLAGFAFMMPAEVAHRLGPFDEDYPLYFEDSDLTRRVRKAGHTCMLVPESEVVHLFNKSAGQFEQESMNKQIFSQQLYFRKHYGSLGGWFAQRVSRWVQKNGTAAGAHTFADPVDLGTLEEPPELKLTRSCDRYIAELTVDPIYTLAVGRVDDRPMFTIPQGVWEHLEQATYYVRFLDLKTFEMIGSYQFQKVSPVHPVTDYQDFLGRLEDAYLPVDLVS